MSENIRIIDCDSLDQFWEAISPIGTLFSSSLSEAMASFVFRGQRDSKWPLVPRIFREDVIANLDNPLTRSMLSDYPGRAFLEYMLLNDFLIRCDSRGLAIPGDSMAFRNYMRNFAMAKHSAGTHSWPDQEIQPLMALAQHHGVPTRLLDVSSNPLVAAYFAAASAVEHGRELCEDLRMVVCRIEVEIPMGTPGVKRVLVPGNTSPNLSAQSGSFLLIENAGYQGEKFVPETSLESKLEMLKPTTAIDVNGDSQILRPMLTKVTLPAVFSPQLLYRCDKFGINAASVFPGYDGAAKAVMERSAAERFSSYRRSS